MLSFLLPLSFAQEVATIQKSEETITIDGILDEESWSKTPPVNTFIQYIPTEGGIPSGDTEIRFLQDDKNIYIGISVSNTDYRPQATITKREEINDDDQVGVYIDTVGDGRTGYIFYFNPYGIQQDIRYANGSWFVQWNTVYYSKGRPRKDGFTIEVAIPFRSLRYPETEENNWRIMLTRKNPDKGSKYAWPKLKRTHPRMFMQAAPLQGIKPPPKGAGISLQPTLSSVIALERDEEDLLVPTTELHSLDNFRPSFDFLWGPTSNTGLAATINPDFSQIEGDVRQLNLNQRFAFYYPERRPFFLDNIDSFSDQVASLYSRSIVNPFYGVKLAGREKNIDFGMLNALDRTPKASVHIDGSSGFSEEDLENQYALNNFGRVRIDAFSQGYVGLSLSDKRILSPELEANGASASTGNIELSIPFAQSWVFNAYNSASFLQSDAERNRGNQAQISISKSPPKGWGGSLSLRHSTPEFRQEMGFLTRSGIRSANANLSYGIPLPKRSFSSTSLSASYLEENNGNRFVSLNIGEKYRLYGTHLFGVSLTPELIRFSDVENQGFDVYAFWNSRVNAKFRFSAYTNIGKTIDYSELTPTSYYNGGLVLTVRPSLRINFSSNISSNYFHPENLEPEFAINTYNRLLFQITRDWGIRLVHQSTFYSQDPPSHNGSLLFTWLTTPGTEAYIGSTWTLDSDQLSSLSFFAKFTKLFRL